MECLKIETQHTGTEPQAQRHIAAPPVEADEAEGDHQNLPPQVPMRLPARLPGPFTNIFDSPVLLPMMPVSSTLPPSFLCIILSYFHTFALPLPHSKSSRLLPLV